MVVNARDREKRLMKELESDGDRNTDCYFMYGISREGHTKHDF